MIELSISDIRRALWRSYSPAKKTNATATVQTGRIFHEVFAALMGDDPAVQWQSVLDRTTLNDEDRLVDHVYDRLLGPRLTAQQASFAEAGDAIWHLWQAVREMCSWLSGLLKEAEAKDILQFDPTIQKWRGAERFSRTEQPLTWELREPGWTAAVRVSGVADAVWSNPQTGRWCVLEFKLGETAPAIDVAQACLYHQMLEASGMSSNGAMALISFHPTRKETFFAAEQLQPAREKLIEFIGKLAGVAETPASLPATNHSTISAGSDEDTRHIGERLMATFNQYGVAVHLAGDPIVGPAFLRFQIMPGKGVKVAEIIRRSEELQVHLKLEQEPMIHKDGGRLMIDIKRPHPETVLFSEIQQQLTSLDPLKGSAKVLLGVDLGGHLHSVDISQGGCPHLLVAGTAGSGKSEWLRSMTAGLLVTNTPETLQLVAIDPKSNCFGGLDHSPFLWKNLGIIHPAEQSMPDILDALIEEMEQRNRLFKQGNYDDLGAYIGGTGSSMPRIVCICDEYADLVADKVARREIEPKIARLGAKARSSGIHLILATQHPKAEIVTSVIKANLSGRVCLRVTDARQSQVVLGQSGAEKLLGKGDLFFLNIGEPVRLQAPYLPKADRERIFKSGQMATQAAQ